tara:strand:+ start:403 stop:597 length:195 start_codon:yes stop_codon:yes gene_type:complete
MTPTIPQRPSELDAAIDDGEAALDALCQIVAQRQRPFRAPPRRVLIANPGATPFPFPISQETDA